MSTWSTLKWLLVFGLGGLAGWIVSPSARVNAQATAKLQDTIYAASPAPNLPAAFDLWPNQPSQSTHWSLEDIRTSHRLLADAAKAGKTLDPDTTLHDFPYWTRTHAMFVRHVPAKATRSQAEQHLGYAQYIVIMGGSGTVQAGGQLDAGSVLVENGRPFWGEVRGRRITGGDTFTLKEGDWVSIPANMPAHFKADSPDGMTYMVMKINAMMYPWEMVR